MRTLTATSVMLKLKAALGSLPDGSVGDERGEGAGLRIVAQQ